MAKKNFIRFIAIATFLTLLIYASTQNSAITTTGTILTSYKTSGTQTLDADDAEAFWSDADTVTIANIDNTGVDVTITSKHNGTHIFVYATWTDDTKDDARRIWHYNSSGWFNLGGNEDRLNFAFTNNSNPLVCGHSSGTGFQFDVWHWKASRTAPAGWADDKYWDASGRQSDAKTSGGYKDNSVVAQAADAAEITTKLGNSTIVSAFSNDDRPYWDSQGTEISWSSGNNVSALSDYIPGYITTLPVGSRGNVLTASMHDGSAWHVEYVRALDTGNYLDDIKFMEGGTYDFYVSFHNNSGDNNHFVAGGTSSPTKFTLTISSDTTSTSSTTTESSSEPSSEPTSEPTTPSSTPGFILIVGLTGVATTYIILKRITKR